MPSRKKLNGLSIRQMKVGKLYRAFFCVEAHTLWKTIIEYKDETRNIGKDNIIKDGSIFLLLTKPVVLKGSRGYWFNALVGDKCGWFFAEPNSMGGEYIIKA